MNDMISLAIASILEKETKDFKKEIAPGVYAVDTTISVTIKATVKKGEPSEYANVRYSLERNTGFDPRESRFST